VSGWTVRLSLADCPGESCAARGARLAALIDELRVTYRGRRGGKRGEGPTPAEKATTYGRRSIS